MGMATRHSRRARWIAALLGGAAAIATQAQAQEPAADNGEIVVTATPIRDSAIRALELQKESDRITTVVASDSIGRFPDQNTAAALARIPGAAVQRDQGQERYVQLRGAPNRWTSVTFDGVPVIGADEGGLERGFRFDAVPAALMNFIEVNRSLTANLPADAVVGQINLVTASPLSRRGFHMQGEAGFGRMELGEGDQEQLALRAGWSGERIGFMVGASSYFREQVTDNREAEYDARGPIVYSFRNYRLERENNAWIAALAIEPTPGHTIELKSLYTEFLDQEDRHQYDFDLLNVRAGAATRSFTSGDLVGVSYRSGLQRGDYETTNQLTTLSGDHEFDGWQASWHVNRTEAEAATDIPITLQTGGRVSVRYDARDPQKPIFSLAQTVSSGGVFSRGADLAALPQAALPVSFFVPIKTSVETTGWTYGVDIERDMAFGAIAFGASVQDRDIDGETISIPPFVPITPFLGAIGATFSPGDYVTNERWISGFPRGFDVNYVDVARLTRDARAIMARLQQAGLYNPNAADPTGRFQIEERIASAYGQATLERGPLTAVAGLRLEQTDLGIDGFVGNQSSGFRPVRVERDSTDWFPSLNLRYEARENLILRGAFVTGIARPSFGSIRTGASADDASTPGTIRGGNPDLQPEKTWGFDGAVERYLDEASLVAVNVFYRNVDNVLFQSASTVRDDRYDSPAANGRPAVDRTGYRFETFLNGSDGELYGVEFAYQQQWTFLPGFWSGFGFQGNLSFLEGSFKTPDGRTADFPGTSETLLNAAFFYEKHGLSARLSYQWRDDWVDGLNLTGDDTFRADTESLDFSGRYAISKTLSLYLDANNLTDETYVAYDRVPSRPIEVEQIGRRFMAGVRFAY